MSSIKNWLLKNNNKKMEEEVVTSEAIEVSDDDNVVTKKKPNKRSVQSDVDKELAGMSSNSDYEPEVPAKKSKKSSAPKKSKAGKIDGQTVEQHRRSMGDRVKSKIHVLGGKHDWGIAARCHTVLPCSVAVFRALVVPSASKVTPAGFDSKTEVVLAEVNSTQQIAEIFGSTKIRGGTRYGSWSARKMDLVFKPQEGQLRAWWVMHDDDY